MSVFGKCAFVLKEELDEAYKWFFWTQQKLGGPVPNQTAKGQSNS